ncbi:TlpA disulfide reductase family protein [Catellatospora sp. NPDC049609]|uniref:TlpA family protein disulfide reductase n=1 Tax=Catellatospora sp. NPDC049609 TaxID=3155505 RepID=UPI00344440B2
MTLIAAGCTGSPAARPDAEVPQPFAACTPLTGTGAQTGAARTQPTRTQPAGTLPTRTQPAGTLRVVALPDLALPCLAGGDDVRLKELRGPLVINLWGSWCAPCREELPAFQRLADSGRVPVLGVVTKDDRAAAAWLADELKAGMPAVYDRAGALQSALGENVLPLTLLVGADGRAAVYRGVALTDDTLSQLVEQHLERA